jgi:tRNA-binding protein
MGEIAFEDFQALDVRVGTVVEVRDFPQARRPAWLLEIDFGPELGRRTSSARLTERYGKPDLLGRQVLAVVNLPARQVGPHRSQVLVLGVADEAGAIRLVVPDGRVPDGARMC